MVDRAIYLEVMMFDFTVLRYSKISCNTGLIFSIIINLVSHVLNFEIQWDRYIVWLSLA
jgi:hypothetical protein